MPPRAAKTKKAKTKDVESLSHAKEAKRKHIPTAELQSFVTEVEAAPKPLRYPRNADLDPQLVWRGKDEQDGDDLIVDTVPIYIQEKVKPEAIVADLMRRSDAARRERAKQEESFVPDLFADFNGLPDKEAELEFYAHDKNWSNRMILGDSLLVMNSLAEKEALKGQVQCIYFDPPYGIKFNSNWQPSTKSRDVKDGKAEGLTREPEMVRAFRDTWKDGIHSYLSYLRDRLTVARDLLTESGSIFVQIGDENVHLVRALMDEVFGRENSLPPIVVWKTSSQTAKHIASTCDFLVWYAKSIADLKFNATYMKKDSAEADSGAKEYKYFWTGFGGYLSANQAEAQGVMHLPRFRPSPMTSQSGSESTTREFRFQGLLYRPKTGGWKSNLVGLERLAKAQRLIPRKTSVSYVRFLDDFPVVPVSDIWLDTRWGFDAGEKIYVVETNPRVVERCLAMASDPGDLVLDPTCGAGTTAFVAEQLGRRWITIDTSRVALALARQRLMSGRFPSYLLQDSSAGARKEGELTKRPPKEGPFTSSVRQGFVYERVPHITLKSIANNAEIDAIWEKWQTSLEPLRQQLNEALGKTWEEWDIPGDPDKTWGDNVRKLHADWWKARRARQEEIDASIARNADTEYLVDKPYVDSSKVRVTGPFSVESLSPHRVLPTDEEADDQLAAEIAAAEGRDAPKRTHSLTRAEAERRAEADFTRVVLDNLKKSGVNNTKKGETLIFTELKPWAGGRYVHAEGRYLEGNKEKRAAVTIGPEYGTVSYGLVRDAAREAIDLFDTLIVCGFAFEPRVNEEALARFGKLTVLKARMNSDLHMANALKATGAGHLFVVFGEPDIKIHSAGNGRIAVEILGLDIFDPTTGEVRSSDLDDIACWFVDTDYDEESFFVRQAYFLGGNDPYKKLKTTLKAEIDEDAWATLYSATSRPFDKPSTGKIAVKVINHYGDEVLKVFEV